MPVLGSYGRILRTPGYVIPFLLCVLVSLGLGSINLGLLLIAHARTGSLGRAGFVAGAFGFSNAVGLLVQGRLIDRFGQPRVLVPAASICAACLVAAVMRGVDQLYGPPCLAATAGAAFPAIIGSMRVVTTSLIVDERGRNSAYALLAVAFGLATVAGPLLVSGAVLIATPALAVGIAAVVIGVGTIGFALSPAVRAWRPSPARPIEHGRLFSSGVVTLVVAKMAMGFAAGIGAVALPAAVLAHGLPALAGVGFALRAAGDVVGGLGYGAIRWPPFPGSTACHRTWRVCGVQLALRRVSGSDHRVVRAAVAWV
jgi:hypothetical protein